MDSNNYDHRSVITTEFLESITGKKVIAFTAQAGSSPGDNYMSNLLSISADVCNSQNDQDMNREFYMLKCYPSQRLQQIFLNRANHFYNELSFYQTITKDLLNFQTNVGNLSRDELIPFPLAIPKFIGGKAIDYTIDNRENSTCHPLDNFIMMEDLKRSYGFKMADVRKGLDQDHLKLALSELATFHALSWAYRQNKGNWHLTEKYPFLKKAIIPQKREMWLGILAENIRMAKKAMDSDNLSKALDTFQEKAGTVIDFFSTQDENKEEEMQGLLRIPPQDSACRWRWRVLCHGDAWCNNLLFQYDCNEKPLQVKLIDFPMVKVGCPTLDLACLVYTSTRLEIRRNHLHECLQIYYNKFLKICNVLKVDLPIGFCMDSLKEKFHVSKLIGLLIAVISLPMNLIGKDEEINGNNMTIEEACVAGVKHALYKEWMTELVQEMCDDGVL